jgi:hypothetical protein
MSAQPLTAFQLQVIEARAFAATEGENGWYADETCNEDEFAIRCTPPGNDEDDDPLDAVLIAVVGPQNNFKGTGARWEDAEFIAHAREDVPHLIATVKALQRALREFGCHSWNCQRDVIRQEHPLPCNCGYYDAALLLGASLPSSTTEASR